MEIDIRTARPKNHVEINEAERMLEKRLEKDVAKGIEIEKRVDSETGRFFIDQVTKRLEDRIDQIAKDDTQCQALLELLEGLGIQIIVGRAASKRLVEMRLRRG